MNHALLAFMGAGLEAREALREHLLTPGGPDEGLCARGVACRPWRQTEEGRARQERLARLMHEHQAKEAK